MLLLEPVRLSADPPRSAEGLRPSGGEHTDFNPGAFAAAGGWGTKQRDGVGPSAGDAGTEFLILLQASHKHWRGQGEVPQGLKPTCKRAGCGMAEAMPFQGRLDEMTSTRLVLLLVCPGSAALQRRVNPIRSQVSRLQSAAQVCRRLRADSVNVWQPQRGPEGPRYPDTVIPKPL